MPKITLPKKKLTIEAQQNSTLMRTLLAKDIPVASSCGGEGICGKCRLVVVEGEHNLSPIRDREREVLAVQKASANERLGCQARIVGDVTLDASYW